MLCLLRGIEHRLTKPNHLWTNGQVERMNRTIKDAIVQRYHYDSHNQLRTHLSDFIAAYNFARSLKTRKGLTPYQFLCYSWQKEPDRFTLNPIHPMPGLYNVQIPRIGHTLVTISSNPRRCLCVSPVRQEIAKTLRFLPCHCYRCLQSRDAGTTGVKVTMGINSRFSQATLPSLRHLKIALGPVLLSGSTTSSRSQRRGAFSMNWIINLFHSLIEAVFGFCSHRNQSRPFTIDGQTYKVCMDCSHQIFYSSESLLPLTRREVRQMLAEKAQSLDGVEVTVMPASVEVREAMVMRARKSAAA